MKLRTICEFLWSMKRVMTPDNYGIDRPTQLRVYKNPTIAEIAQLNKETEETRSSIAGILTNDPAIYIWDRRLIDHEELERLYQLYYSIAFYLSLSKTGQVHIEVSQFSTDMNLFGDYRANDKIALASIRGRMADMVLKNIHQLAGKE